MTFGQLDVSCMIASFSDPINRAKNEATCIIDHTLKVSRYISFTSTNLVQCRLVQSGNSTFYTWGSSRVWVILPGPHGTLPGVWSSLPLWYVALFLCYHRCEPSTEIYLCLEIREKNEKKKLAGKERGKKRAEKIMNWKHGNQTVIMATYHQRHILWVPQIWQAHSSHPTLS